MNSLGTLFRETLNFNKTLLIFLARLCQDRADLSHQAWNLEVVEDGISVRVDCSRKRKLRSVAALERINEAVRQREQQTRSNTAPLISQFHIDPHLPHHRLHTRHILKPVIHPHRHHMLPGFDTSPATTGTLATKSYRSVSESDRPPTGSTYCHGPASTEYSA